MPRKHKGQATTEQLVFVENLIALSVDLHNLNAEVHRRGGLSIVQWLVLKNISTRPGVSAGSLARISGVQPSTLTPTLSRLRSSGLIYIQSRPTDRRRKLLLISWKGLVSYRRTEAILVDALYTVDTGGVAAEGLQQIKEISKRLISNLS